MVTKNQNRDDSIAGPAQLLIEEVWSRGDLALVDELVTGEYVQIDPLLSEPIHGPEALAQTISWYRQGVPDLTKTPEEPIVDGTVVVIPYTATGTHEGWILGIEPSGREFEVDGLFRSDVTDGRLRKGIDVWNGIGLLRQLGALPEPLANRKHP